MKYDETQTYFALFHIGKNEVAEEKWCLGDAEWDFGAINSLQISSLFRTQKMHFRNGGYYLTFYLPPFYPGFRLENYLPSLIKCFYHAAYSWNEKNSQYIIKQLIDSEMERIYLKEQIKEHNIKVITWNT